MSKLLSSLGIRLLVWAVTTYLLWRFLGAIGIVVAAPLCGVLVARPIIELMSHARDSAKALAYNEIQGRHFEHRGFSLDVVEDDDHFRWISWRDVRKLVPGLPRPQVLEAQFPGEVRTESSAHEARIFAEALADYLAKSTEADSIKFRNWVQREVISPGEKVRARFGIKKRSPADTQSPE